MRTKLFALILMLVLMLLSLVPAVHAETWTKHDIDTIYANMPAYLMIYDIDSDTDPDVVVALFTNDAVWWYEAPGWTKHEINVTGDLDGAYGVFVHDMDGDNDPDVVASGYSANKVVWFECPSAPTTGNWNNYTIGSAVGPGSVYVADIDGDGKPDVVASVHAGGKVVWFEAVDPKTTWSEHVIDDSLPSAQGVCVADMDGDGDPDVVASADGDSNVVVWYECPTYPTTEPWLRHTIDSYLAGAVNVDVADIDGDGNPDVVATGYYADVVVWYEAPDNPTESWTRRVIDSSLNGAWGVHIYSMDGWSTLDVVATADVDDVVVWYQGPPDIGTNPGASWTKKQINAVDDPIYARGVDVYDIDEEVGQGPDVVVSEWSVPHDVVWYKSDWSGLWPIPEVPLGTILLLGTGLLIPVAIAAAKWLRLNHRLSR